MNMILRGAEFALKAHRGQFRKYTGRPYIEHPARVAAKVTIYLAGHPRLEDIIVAAWNHDVPEDTDYTFDDLLAAGFSDYSVNIVRELTNPSKGLRLPRAERKRIDREHLSVVSYEAKVLKLIDRLDNVEEMRPAEPDFIKLYISESRLLVDTILRNESDQVLFTLSDQVRLAMGSYSL